jgi:hypothetical protein
MYFPSFLLVFVTISVHWRAVAVGAGAVRSAIRGGYVGGHKYARRDELQVARSAIASRGTDLSNAHIFGDSIPVFKDLSFQWTAVQAT